MENRELIYKARVDFGGSTFKDFELVQKRFIDIRKQIDQLSRNLSTLKKELKTGLASGEIKEGSKDYTNLITKIATTEKALKSARTTQRELNKEFDLLAKPVGTIGRLRGETNKLAKSLEVQKRGVTITAREYDKLKSKLEQNRAAIIKYDQSVNDGRSNVGRYQTALRGLNGALLKSAGAFGVAFGAASALRGVTETVKVFSDFTRQISFLGAVTKDYNASAEQNAANLKALEDNAKSLGASTQFSASQVAQLEIEYAKLGFKPAEILNSTADSLNLASVAQSELGRTAQVVGATLNAFQLDASETRRVTDVLAKSFTSSALDISKFETSIGTVLPVANSFGFSLEETTALLGKLNDAGFDASSGATALRNIFLNLADGNGKLAKSLGGPATNLEELLGGLQKLSASGIDLAGTLDLTDKRSVAAFNTLLRGTDDVKGLATELQNAAGFSKEAGDAITNDLKGGFDRFLSALEGFQIRISEIFGPTIRRITEGAASLFQPLGDAFTYIFEILQPLRNALGRFFGIFSDGAGRFNIFGNALEFVRGSLNFLVTAIVAVIDTASNLIQFFVDGAKAVPFFSAALDVAIGGVNLFLDAAARIPALISGVLNVVANLANQFTNTARRIFLEAQILYSRIASVFSDAAAERLKNLQSEKEEIKKSGKSMAQAFSEGYDQATERIDLKNFNPTESEIAQGESFLRAVGSRLSGAVNDGARGLASFVGKFSEGGESAINGFADFFGGAVNKISEIAKGGGEKAANSLTKPIAKAAKQVIAEGSISALQKEIAELNKEIQDGGNDQSVISQKLSEVVEKEEQVIKLKNEIDQLRDSLEFEARLNDDELQELIQSGSIPLIESQLSDLRETIEAVPNSEAYFAELKRIIDLQNSLNEAKKQQAIIEQGIESGQLNSDTLITNPEPGGADSAIQPIGAIPIDAPILSPEDEARIKRAEDLNAKLNKVYADGAKERADVQIKEEERAAKEAERFQNQRAALVRRSTEQLGEILGGFLSDSERDQEEFRKSLISLALDTLEGLATIAIAQIVAKELGSKSFAGIATAAILGGLVKAAVAGAKRSLLSRGGRLGDVNQTQGASVKIGEVAKGPSHSKGGIKVKGTDKEMEGGEFTDVDEFGQVMVISKQKTRENLPQLKKYAGQTFAGKHKFLERMNGGFDTKLPQYSMMKVKHFKPRFKLMQGGTIGQLEKQQKQLNTFQADFSRMEELLTVQIQETRKNTATVKNLDIADSVRRRERENSIDENLSTP